MRGVAMLVAARARRRPGRWLAPLLGIALAAAFAGAVATEGTIAGDQAARGVLSSLRALDRSVRLTWQGALTPAVRRQAPALLSELGLGPQTQVVLLNPVRLDGILVRPAAISPLPRWASGPAPGPCRPSSCPMLVAGSVNRRVLGAFGVRIPLLARTTLASPVPLGFSPSGSPDEGVLLLTGDLSGLETLPGLSGVYRTHDWVAELDTSHLHSWQLAQTEQRLQSAQASLLATGGQFTIAAPFDALDAARAQASAAPNRLLLAGGGALTALALFVILTAASLRRDVREEQGRLRIAGATEAQCALFAVLESAWLAAAALGTGALLALGVAALMSGLAGEPVGGVLAHSLLTVPAALALVGALMCTCILLVLTVSVRSARVADVAAVAAVATLALALTRAGRTDPLAVLLAPLACVALGVLVFRASAAALRASERFARRGPLLLRLAVVDLARAPAAASLAIAFVAVSTGLGAFALAYRATLDRSAADQAAAQVPLDATVTAGGDFATPLQVAPLARWRALSGGELLPVRRTQASFVSGGASVTVSALGVPAGGLAQLHGWRAGDAATRIGALARRLEADGPARVPGPALPRAARRLQVTVESASLAVGLTADLRDPDGGVDQVQLGSAERGPTVLRGRIPAGSWELEALELDAPPGLAATNGHQNAENPAPTTQGSQALTLSAVSALDGKGRRLLRASIADWHGVGAVRPLRAAGRGGRLVLFDTGEDSGLLRPAQPIDYRPLPVLVDPGTAAAAGRGGLLAMTVDEVPLVARVTAVLRRFPTVQSGSAGFVVADEPALASALDAAIPGQGEANELWISTPDQARLRGALTRRPLAQLDSAFRVDIERSLGSAPIARGVLGTLIAATALGGLLSVIGVLVALLGAARDERVEADLLAQGLGPRAVRRELRMRLAVVGTTGVLVGVAIGILLTRLAIAVVQAAGAVAAPQPPVVTVTPWAALALWAVVAIAALAAISLGATRSLVRGRLAR